MRIVALIVALLLQDEARKEWEGFAEGSSVTLRITESDGEKQESSLARYTISRVAADAVIVKMEIPGRSKEATTPLKRDESIAKAGRESLDIDGKTIACTVYEKAIEEKGAKVHLRQWMSRDVPGRVARREIAHGDSRSVGRITRLNQTTHIGGKAVTYAIWESTIRTQDGLVRSELRWISEQVPGFLVKEEVRLKREGGRRESVSVKELVEFDVK